MAVGIVLFLPFHSTNYSLLVRDYDHLKGQYASLEVKFTRAAERYKVDYKKWHDFQQYLKGEDKKHRAMRNQAGVMPDEQARLEAQSIKNKMAYLQNMGPNLQPLEGKGDIPPPMGGTELPEHFATPQLRPSNMVASSFASTSRILVGSSGGRPIDRIKRQYAMPSASPTMFSMANKATGIRQEVDVANSSDTEPASPCKFIWLVFRDVLNYFLFLRRLYAPLIRPLQAPWASSIEVQARCC